jgi:hypothetical protein
MHCVRRRSGAVCAHTLIQLLFRNDTCGITCRQEDTGTSKGISPRSWETVSRRRHALAGIVITLTVYYRPIRSLHGTDPRCNGVCLVAHPHCFQTKGTDTPAPHTPCTRLVGAAAATAAQSPGACGAGPRVAVRASVGAKAGDYYYESWRRVPCC